MTSSSRRDEEAIRASVARLGEFDDGRAIDAHAVGRRIARELHALLGRDALAVVYRPSLVAREWVVASAGTSASILEERLAPAATRSAQWFAYDPLRPQAAQRNRVMAAERDALPADSSEFFQQFGRAIGQTRALLCDGPVLLAWVGILRPRDRDHARDAHILRRLAASARRALRFALQVPHHGASLEASMDAYPGEAYVVRADGRVDYANALGAQTVGIHRRELARAVARYPRPSPCFELHPIRAAGATRHFIATRPTVAPSDLEQRLAHAAAEWRLTPKQVDVLRRLALGDANKDIAARLAVSPRTVEDHVARLLVSARTDTRLRLVAKLWGVA